MSKISAPHARALQNIYRCVQDGTLAEEFPLILWAGVAQFQNRDQIFQIHDVSLLALRALEDEGFLRMTSTGRDSYLGIITPEGVAAVESGFAEPLVPSYLRPVEISESLERFQRDFPDPSKVAFLMMQFGETAVHKSIRAAVEEALQSIGMVALRADHREYHEDVLYNILTYIHGCRFGVAVYERILDNAFNPNVSLEVGYMMGIGKPVCHLKDRTLPNLQSDLVGKLYRPFDPMDVSRTVPVSVIAWIRDRGFN